MSRRMVRPPWPCGSRHRTHSSCWTCTCRCSTALAWPRRSGMRARHGLPRTGLIAVTADALKGEDARCFAAGMDGFLPKPVSLDALARTLGRWIPDLAPPPRRPKAPAGALFDPEALRGLFGADATSLAALLQNFADSAARDVAAIRGAADARQLAAFGAPAARRGAHGGGKDAGGTARRASKRQPRPAILPRRAARGRRHGGAAGRYAARDALSRLTARTYSRRRARCGSPPACPDRVPACGAAA